MSADDLHTTCIREDPDREDYTDPLDNTVGARGDAAIANLWDDEYGYELSEVCEEARELVYYTLRQPSPHARYQVMVAVIGNLLWEVARVKPPRQPPTTTTPA